MPGNTVGSKFAEAIDTLSSDPAGNRTPRYSMSSLAKRTVPRTAPK